MESKKKSSSSCRASMGLLTPVAYAVVSVLGAAYFGPHIANDVPLEVEVSSSLLNKHILITGGSSGVGLTAASNLASRGATVYITGRSKGRVNAAAAKLGGKGVGLVLDLTSRASVDSFAQEFMKALSTSSLDAAILNAGMMYDAAESKGPYTVDFSGNGSRQDTMVAANHLGHFRLLQQLLATVISSNTRVVFTSSISHQFGTEEGVLPEGGWKGIAVDGEPVSVFAAFRLYGNTKLMNVLVANKLQRIFDSDSNTSATVVVCTPGFVATNIGTADRNKGWSPLEYVPLARSAENGGMVLAFATTVDAERARGKMLQPYWIWEGIRKIVSDTVTTGFFFNIVQELFLQKLTPAGTVYAHSMNPVGTDERVQDLLWAHSEDVAGQL